MKQVHEGGVGVHAAQVVDDHGQHGEVEHDLQPQPRTADKPYCLWDAARPAMAR